MQENKKRESLESKLRDELRWYTLYASPEEFDEKAVDSIMYLLDRWAPLKEGTVPPVEESWKRFLKVADRKELLPVEDGETGKKPVREGAVTAGQKPVPEVVVLAGQKPTGEGAVTAGQEPVQRETVAAAQKSVPKEEATERQKAPEMQETGQERKTMFGRSVPDGLTEQSKQEAVSGQEPEARHLDTGQNEETREGFLSAQQAGFRHEPGTGEDAGEQASGKAAGQAPQGEKAGSDDSRLSGAGESAGRRKVRKLAKFASRHKITAAAVVVLMILMVGNTIHVVANPEAEFFFWMKRDDSGVKMITSPEQLDDKTNNNINIYYKQEEVPEWAKKWTQIETGIEFGTQEAYELHYIEISELDNRQHVASIYSCEALDKEIVIGAWIYWGKVSYFREGFVGYDYVQSYELNQKEVDVYKKTEKTGKIYHIVCFYDGNCQYYVRGRDNLDELKKIIEKYWGCVQNNP